jgi:hypothetical protein
MSGALADECGDHLQPGGVDPLEGSDIERYGLRFLEETSETLFEGARIRHGALGRQGECV